MSWLIHLWSLMVQPDKQWEGAVRRAWAFSWQRVGPERWSLAESCFMANTLSELLVGSTAHRFTEGPSSHMVPSCCSRSQGSCSLFELLGDIVTLFSVLLATPKGYFSKIPELWDYWIQLIVQGCCAGSLSSCFPVLFLQDHSVSSTMENEKALDFAWQHLM